jgi:3-dehydroquinate synthetase
MIEGLHMLMTRASEYAILSLIILAKADKPLDVDTLSRELDISKSFLAKILQAMKFDKKFQGKKNRFVLSPGIGRVLVRDGVAVEKIRAAIQNYL